MQKPQTSLKVKLPGVSRSLSLHVVTSSEGIPAGLNHSQLKGSVIQSKFLLYSLWRHPGLLNSIRFLAGFWFRDFPELYLV